jgi:hypothetical protein
MNEETEKEAQLIDSQVIIDALTAERDEEHGKLVAAYERIKELSTERNKYFQKAKALTFNLAGLCREHMYGEPCDCEYCSALMDIVEDDTALQEVAGIKPEDYKEDAEGE